MASRVSRAIRDIALGLRNGYPICCVMNYALDSIVETPAGLRRGEKRDPILGTYVPCVLHAEVRKPLSRSESLQLLNSGFAVTHLAPDDSVEVHVNGRIVSGLRIPKGTDAVFLSQVRMRELAQVP
jgi:hypothetical protein